MNTSGEHDIGNVTTTEGTLGAGGASPTVTRGSPQIGRSTMEDDRHESLDPHSRVLRQAGRGEERIAASRRERKHRVTAAMLRDIIVVVSQRGSGQGIVEEDPNGGLTEASAGVKVEATLGDARERLRAAISEEGARVKRQRNEYQPNFTHHVRVEGPRYETVRQIVVGIATDA